MDADFRQPDARLSGVARAPMMQPLGVRIISALVVDDWYSFKVGNYVSTRGG